MDRDSWLGRVPARWIRVALFLLALPNLIAGLWAMVAPRSWFDDFPGWAPRLVAAIPPYNEHLATDAGAGLFATGAAAAIAAWWMRREVTLLAMAVYLSFAAPHALYHLTHPADALTAAQDAVNVITLLLATAVAAIVFVTAVWAPARTVDR